MKRKTILILVTMLAMTLAIVPISAKVEYKATGEITDYLGGIIDSEVVDGRWDVKVKDGVVEWKGL